jgi:hypothetical protein
MIDCASRDEFSKEDIEILGSITPNIRNGKWKAECTRHTEVPWPYLFCEQILDKGLCPLGMVGNRDAEGIRRGGLGRPDNEDK